MWMKHRYFGIVVIELGNKLNARAAIAASCTSDLLVISFIDLFSSFSTY